MAKQFLDASGLNQYTKALKNGTLIVGKATEASHAATAEATGLIGIIPLENIPQGALEKLVKVDNEAARFNLTTEQVQNGDSVLQIDTNVMYIVVDDKKLNSEEGYVEYAAGTAAKALNADFATNAGHANNADDASTAKEAAHASKADDASTAKTALNANHADTADDASTAKTSLNANHANTADDASTAKTAGWASKADDASTAKEADHASKADDASTAKEAIHATYADDASTAKQAPWSGITGKPGVFMPDVDSASLATYSKDASTGDINTSDSLVTALAKLENKAEAGADERIPNDVIDSIVNGSYKPTV